MQKHEDNYQGFTPPAAAGTPASNGPLSFLDGRSVPPAIAGALRAILLAAAMATCEKTISVLAGAHLPLQYAVWVPVVVLVLRTIEGFIDQAQGQPPPPKV